MVGDLTDGYLTAMDCIGHKVPQAESPCMVFHPTSLECRILAVVGKEQQAFSIGVLDHVLSQHVDVRDMGRTQLSHRFAEALPEILSPSSTGEAGAQKSRLFVAGSNGKESDLLAR